MTSGGPTAQVAGVVPAAGPGPALAARRPRWWERLLSSDSWVLLLSILYFLAMLPFEPALANPENIELIIANSLPLLAVALGQTVVLITGGIDLSVTSIVALTSVAGAGAMTGLGLSGPGAVAAGAVIMMLVGAAVGAINGAAVTRLSMPPFMVTLATMMGVSGLAIYVTRSQGIPGLPPALAVLAQENLAPMAPVALLVVVPLVIVGHLTLTRLRMGRWLFAVGINVRTARVSGVPVRRTVLFAYVFAGVCAALASLLYTGRLETGSPIMGQRIFLDVIGAVVIGGTSLFGGKGSIRGTVFGVLLITLIDNSLNMLGFSSFSVLMVKGTVILLAALLDVLRSRRMGGRA